MNGSNSVVYQQQHDVLILDATTGPADALRIEGLVVVGLVIPSGFDGTSVKFSVSLDDSTYYTLVDPDTGSDVAVAAGASEAYAINPALLKAWKFLKLVVGTQTGDITLTLVTEPNYP